MTRPGIIITGASGFLGRHLLSTLRSDYRVFAIARRAQARSGVAPGPDVEWIQADIGESPLVSSAFRSIRESGGAETVVHLAAHFDFSGEENPEYWRTNLIGLRHVLDAAVANGVKHFVFASSVLACRPPRPGRAITEASLPHGKHTYAATKREGEALMFEYSDRLHPVIVRFAPLFSDWCEYPPLFVQLQTWLGEGWNQRLLIGHGRTSVPYLHVSDAVLFLLQVQARLETLKPAEVLLASPDGATTQKELFEAATMSYFGSRREAIHLPRALAAPLMRARDLSGRVTGNRPFERPWMAEHVDQEMRVDASRTRLRLDWSPRPRLEILRRLPFLVENMKTDPVTWAERNRAAMKAVKVPTNLKVHWLLEQHQETIVRQFADLLADEDAAERFTSYQRLTRDQREWNTRLTYRTLLNAVRTQDKGVFIGYCRDLAEQRLKEGFTANELCGALESLNLVCWRVLRGDPESNGMREAIFDYVTSTLRSGCDCAQEVFELAEARRHREAGTG